MRTTEEGGIGVSDLYIYYLAAQVMPTNDWFVEGWDDLAYRLEIHEEGFGGLLDMLYGGRVPVQTVSCTRVEVVCWDRRLTRRTPLWNGD
ncbi:hypothetical protein NDU88_004890 [Pleurodeles waltl]|uniref:Uncharacterized protein n=1 Tax=Pleurodeles waltl TaxID=8319 RepID=A0AAV7TAY2_PLEWA|nr:hypothetical protein NDU88_004890 [Pleurodeles waltl]